MSDDGRRLAYTLDFTGFRDYTLYVKDLVTGELAPERIDKVSSVAWATDSTTMFYVLEDEAKRPYRLWRHRLGAPVADDALLYEESDALFRLGVWRSRSRALLFAGSGSFTTTEIRWLPAGEPTGDWRLVLAREKEHEYSVDHGVGPDGDVFYIRTNGGGRRNFRLVVTPMADVRPERWRELIVHREDVMLEDVDVFAGFYVVHERAEGLLRLRITELGGEVTHHVEFPEPAYEVSSDVNAEFATPRYRLRYQSFVTPASVYDYEVGDRRLVLLKRQPVLGDFDPTRYRSERIHATAADGVRVPISLVYPVGTARDGSSPMLLTGYGAYGIPYPVTFSSSRLSLLDRGADGRPSPTCGAAASWASGGTTTARCSASATRLPTSSPARTRWSERGYTAPDRLVIEGGSAGGLLIGAVLNLRPDLAHGGPAAGAVRGRDQHDARRVAAADGRRVRGVGQPEDPRALRLHEDVLPVHQPRPPAVPRTSWSAPRSTTAR